MPPTSRPLHARWPASALAGLVLSIAPAAAHEALTPEIAALTRAIARSPGDATAYLRRAELRRLIGAWDEAEDDLALARGRGAEPALVARSRAALELDRGRPAAALAALAEAGGDPASHRLRARALVATNRLTEAAAALADAIAASARPSPDDVIERAGLLRQLPGGLVRALAAIDDGLSRLGPLVALEDAAIELERTLGRTDRVRERLDRMAPQLAPGGDAIPARPGSGRGVMRADALPAEPAGAQAPLALMRGPYLAMAGPDRITIRWRTSAPALGLVRYGSAPDQLTSVAYGASSTTEHEVPITGLDATTPYYYAVGTADTLLAGGDPATRFVTAPPAGSLRPTRVWVIGDSGFDNAAAHAVRDAYAAWTGERGTDAWLMLGDNAYGAGTDAEYQSGVFDNYATMLRQVAPWPTRGNHDVLYSGPNNDYYDFFSLPSAAEFGGLASGTEAYYSFDRANVHFICLDSEGTSRAPGGAMMRWLRSDAAATTQDWIVAYWHHPPYTKGSHDSDDPVDSGGRMRDMRQYALPILDSIGVDLVLTGHSHCYERSFLLNGHYGTSETLESAMKVDSLTGRVDDAGPYAKGQKGSTPFSGTVYAVAGSAAQTSGGALNHPVMIASLNQLGSLVLDFDDQRLDGRFLDATGVVRDSFRIVKGTLPAGAPRARAGPRLAAPAPNPARGATRLGFELPSAGEARLDVVDIAGRHVATLLRGRLGAGPHAAQWNGRDARGRSVPSGAYFAVLEHGGVRRAARIAWLR